MLNTKYVREHLDEIRSSLEKRRSDYPLDELLRLDEEWRRLKTELQNLQAEQNRASIEISKLKKERKDTAEKIEKLKALKQEMASKGAMLNDYEGKINKLLLSLPNILHESVKYGKDENDNIEVRRWGDASKKGVPPHSEILEGMGLVDIERAAKAAGSRFYYLKGEMVNMALALERFAIDELTKKGYMQILPPYMIKKEYYMGVTSLGDFEESLYMATEGNYASSNADYEKMEDTLFLIATSEHAIAAMHAGEVFSSKKLPLKYVGISPCFRREAGAHGKDTKGIFRVHQFEKVEQFIFSRAEDSWKYFDEIVGNEEEIFRKLKIPYRVVEMCTGEIGIVAAKKVDVEGWFPSQGRYRELTSASNCTDWQSLRLDIKYDEGNERKYVHTLNGTGIAIERTMAAIVENYYNADGTITVPDALVPYMGKDKITKI
ncbi:MAG: serine--tRNA ligase, partial [Candidatus Micrarchaeaceae archaeon]